MAILPVGLLLGRAIVQARKPAVQAIARTSAIASTSTHPQLRRSARHSSTLSARNPFDKDELLSRLGGRGIRSLSGRSKLGDEYNENNKFDEKELQKQVADAKWVAVYRYPLVRLAVLVARAKLLQTIASLLYLPYSYYNYSHGLIDYSWFLNTAIMAIFAPIALLVFTRTMNRLVGVVAMDETNQYVRVGYVSFWGRRKNKIRPLEDVEPLADAGADMSHKLVKLAFISDSSYLLLPTRNAEIVDEKRANLIFGDLGFFGIKQKE